MRLSELAEGTPIRLEASRDGEKKTEIWGKYEGIPRRDARSIFITMRD